MLSLLPAVLLLAGGLAARNLEPPDVCPQGQHREMTDDPYQALKCVKDSPRASRLSQVAGPQGFKFRPKCPHGTRPAENPGGLQAYRCVPIGSASSNPELAPLRGEASGQETAPPPSAEPLEVKAHKIPRSFRRYTVLGELSFEYPDVFVPTDAWKDETPMLSFVLDDGTPGKPVTLTLSRAEPGQAAYVDMEAAISKDKDWQGAKDAGTASVAGRRTRFTSVAGESQTAYVPLGGGAYYTVIYSAPADSFAVYLPTFDRLLKSLRLIGKRR